MADQPETPTIKEWVRMTHAPSGTTVSVTMQQGNVSAKYVLKSYVTTVEADVKRCKQGAMIALKQLRSALEVTP